MYRDFFQLDDYPFRLTADARYFFMGEGHGRATAYLNYLFEKLPAAKSELSLLALLPQNLKMDDLK